jgi:hypothetical protein
MGSLKIAKKLFGWTALYFLGAPIVFILLLFTGPRSLTTADVSGILKTLDPNLSAGLQTITRQHGHGFRDPAYYLQVTTTANTFAAFLQQHHPAELPVQNFTMALPPPPSWWPAAPGSPAGPATAYDLKSENVFVIIQDPTPTDAPTTYYLIIAYY